jgi:hypothetical protein
MLTGGCNCKSIRYTIDADPIMVAQCHCRNCQRQSGSAFSVNVVVANPAVTVTGTLTDYADSDTKSGNTVLRQFCATCGSPIFSRVAGDDKTVIVKAGTLDDPAAVSAPPFAVWTSTCFPWVEPREGQITFPENPPQRG